jgi:cytochrome P450
MAESDRGWEMSVPNRVPGPDGLPGIGSLLGVRRDVLGVLEAARRAHGDVVRVWAGPPGLRSVFYAVFSPEGVRQVLSGRAADFRKDNQFYDEVRASFGNGLLTSQDAEHVRQRRLVQPAFTPRRVDGYAERMVREVRATVARWGDEVDLGPEMTGMTLRVVTQVLFGAEASDAERVVRRCFPVVNAHLLRRGFAPLRTPRHWPTPANRRAAAARAELYATCDRIVAARRAGGTADDLLSRLVQARDERGDRLSAEEIRDQVLILLLAGHETTATSLTCALRLLATHPEVQERVREEVDRVVGAREPRASDLPELRCTTRVLKEAMRLYPAIPMMGRRCHEDVEVNGLRVPAGSDVFVSAWITHRHPEHWEDPEVFDPDRFLPENEAARPRYAWLPFGGGPRACIGQHFSLLEAALALAVVVQHHELSAVGDGMPVAFGATLQVTGPVRCRVTRRALA